MRWRRFLIVAAVVAAGGVALLEVSARSAAVDIARALEPMATLTYDSAGVAADGSIRLQDPRLLIKRGYWQGTVKARLARLRGSGPLWLLGRFFSADASAPASLVIQTWGLRLGGEGPDLPLEGWLGTADLALFENIGCGNDALSDKDRRRMGVDTRERIDHFDYQYDPDHKQLRLSADLLSPDIAEIHGFAEVSGFDGMHWQDPKAQAAARLARSGFSYRDSGYFGRRNNFCAQWLGISSSEFVSRHLDAVEVFLGAHGVEPSREVRSLYQQLVTRGGTVSLVSLPDASWVPVEIAAYPREDLLRQLNITARLEDAPPIMLRLAFTEPDTPLNLAAAVLPLASATVVKNEVADSTVAVSATGTLSPGALPASEPSRKDPVSTKEVESDSALVVAPAKETTGPINPINPVVQDAPVRETSLDKDGGRRVIASSPPPPKDSTLALVWKPGVIERLPEQTAKKKDYSVVSVDRLRDLTGTRVAIVTTNGKVVEGEVKDIATDHVVLQIQVGRGTAELNVPLNRVREVRVPTTASPSS
jgi:hypothetical protein